MTVPQLSSPTPVRLVLARLSDFFAHGTPWHRRLWNIGTSLALHEVVEYADACLSKAVTNTEGLQYVVETAKREVRRDPGTRPIAEPIVDCLERLNAKSSSDIDLEARDRLNEFALRVEFDYLDNWCEATVKQPVEFSARALASHLLDLGFSPDHLHRWITAIRSSIITLNELADATRGMAKKSPTRQYNVFVPCAAPFRKPKSMPGPVLWMEGSEATAWLRANLPNKEVRRHAGGFKCEVTSRDPWSAIEKARVIIARADARAKVSRPSHDTIRINGWARIADDARTYEIRPTPRQVKIGSLYRHDAVYRFDGGLPAATDDVLELASYMESPSMGAAVTGGWAAIEALLIRPGEGKHYVAADRLASLIACSLPRAELTPLAYTHMKQASDTLAVELNSSHTNFNRVKLVEDHLRTHNLLTLTDGSDIAAQNRLIAIIGDPATELARIKTYVTESLRRLYNQRNTVTHSGSLQSKALSATARTALSLVGAGLDRIVHAQLESAGQLAPLGLVARAENELGLVGTPSGRSLSSLLE